MPGIVLPAAAAGSAAMRALGPRIAAVLGNGAQYGRTAAGNLAVWFPQNLTTFSLFGRSLPLGTFADLALRAAKAVGWGAAIWVATDVAANIVGGDIVSPLPIGGGTDGAAHPGQVVKSWEANGVAMVRLADGRMGAYSKKRGSWKYWRPKKPIVIYSGGSSSLQTLLKADKATEKQLRKLKKAIDRRFPGSSRRRSPTMVIQEQGPGGIQVAPKR